MIGRLQARRFLLKKQGLLGATRFRGEEGLLAYVRQAGCVQYDPVDVCGKSHELSLLARVEGFSKPMLTGLLYERRALFDYYDKNMCILPVEAWPYVEPMRRYCREHTPGREQIAALAPELLRHVHQRGSLSSRELDMPEKVDWYWSATSLSRAALESLYYWGELVVHHKTRTVKSYALPSDCLPGDVLGTPCPFRDTKERYDWQVARRVGAVGLLWNAPSDAWLGMNWYNPFHAEDREATFARLEKNGTLTAVQVEGVPKPLFLRTEDLELLELSAAKPGGRSRARFLGPLDCLLWDRKLISRLFDFDYTWEIYTPEAKRKYAHYTVPVLYGEAFAGRAEPVCDRKRGLLLMKRFWPEKGFRVTEAFRRALTDAADGLRACQGLDGVAWGLSEREQMGDDLVVPAP